MPVECVSLQPQWGSVCLLLMWSDGDSSRTWWQKAPGKDSYWRRVLFICMHLPGSPYKILMKLGCRGSNLPLKSLLHPPHWGCVLACFEKAAGCVCLAFLCMLPILLNLTLYKQGCEPEIRIFSHLSVYIRLCLSETTVLSLLPGFLLALLVPINFYQVPSGVLGQFTQPAAWQAS